MSDLLFDGRDLIPRLHPISTALRPFHPDTLRELGLQDFFSTGEADAARLARERAERDRILRHLATLRQGYLVEVRAHLRSLGRDVTADDARAFFESLPGVPGPDTLSRNFLGAVFKAPGWMATGDMALSATRGRHASRILVWRWMGGD